MHTLRWMARLAAASAGLFAGVAAQAENWWYVSHNAQQLVVIDADSIEGSGNSRTATVRTYPIAADGPPHIAGVRIEADCAGNRVRYLRMTAYTDALGTIMEGPPPDGFQQWRQLTPSNNGALVVRFACGEREASDWRALRIGALTGRAEDRPLLATLVREGVPEPLAALFALGIMSRDESEAMFAEIPAENVATLRRHGFPR